jgi:hypothetical protein
MLTDDNKVTTRKMTCARDVAYALYEVRSALVWRHQESSQLLITMTHECWRDVLSDHELRYHFDPMQFHENKLAGVPCVLVRDNEQNGEPFKIWVLAERRIPERRV